MDNSIQVGGLLLMFVVGFIGVLAHWAKAAIRKQATRNLLRYLFVEQRGASGTMFVSYCVAIWGLYSIGAFDLVKIEYIREAWNSGYVFKPFLHAVVESITVGYVCDSAFNRPGKPKNDRRAEFQEMPK